MTEKPNPYWAQPTVELRFVERYVTDGHVGRNERILQQRVEWWAPDRSSYGFEWKDVPTGTE